MALSSAEKARLWRKRHPEAARAHLETLKTKPRKKRAKIVTPPVRDGVTRSGVIDTPSEDRHDTTAQGSDTPLDTMTADHVKSEPPPAAPAPFTVVTGLVSELEAVRQALQVAGLPPGELTRLRLLADVTSRLIVAQATLQRLPKPLVPADDPLRAYREQAKPPKAPRKAALPRTADFSPAPEPEPAPAPAALDF